jgi:hypothetical protein
LLSFDEKISLRRAGGLLPEKTCEDKEELATPTEHATLSYREALKRKREERSRGATSRYHPAIAEAIPCSAAEVERIWSRARHVLTRERSTMAPILFEAIMFLKYNRRLWGLAEVVEANKRRKGQRAPTTFRNNIRKQIEARLEDVEEWEATVLAE